MYLTVDCPRLVCILCLNGEEKTDKNIYSDYIFSLSLREARKEFEYDYILKNLNRFDGNISKTAKFIGMERSAFHRKLSLLKSDKDINSKKDIDSK